MLKLYVRHEMILEKNHEMVGKKSFNTQKRNKAKKEFDKDFYNLLI